MPGERARGTPPSSGVRTCGKGGSQVAIHWNCYFNTNTLLPQLHNAYVELLDCDDKIVTSFSADMNVQSCVHHPSALTVSHPQPCMNKGKGWIGMLPGCEYQILMWGVSKGVDDMNIKHRYGINNNCLIYTIDVVMTMTSTYLQLR